MLVPNPDDRIAKGPVSTSAASHLSPSFPLRALWGTAGKLRAWQQAALEEYLRRHPRDFLAVATPGAGKTTFALRVAAELLERRLVQAITIVAPTDHLKQQWADAAHRAGIAIDPSFRNAAGAASADFTGVAVTYAGVAAHPMLHRRRCEQRRMLVILDEIHHAGDALSWGEATQEAFEPAARRLALTGTPFRSDTNPIPFVDYVADASGAMRSAADFTYGYPDALRDGVVRPVIFLAYAGEMRWRTRAGDEVSASLGTPLPKDVTAQALRTALDAEGDWIPQVLAAADRRLAEVRRGLPDAAGLVIATDQAAARAYAAVLTQLTGASPAVVLSDDRGASQRIAAFADSDEKWMVAVRMVSEGVDIPRLAVGVYATSTTTPLFFAQAVGRFVRARRRGETASVFVPSVPALLQHAAELEVERDHVVKPPGGAGPGDVWVPEDAMAAAAQAGQGGPGGPDAGEVAFAALESAATFDRVLYDGGEFGNQAVPGSPEEEDYLGIPGLLEPDQVAALLRRRQAEQLAAQRNPARPSPQQPSPPSPIGGAAELAGGDPGGPGGTTTHASLKALRKELNSLVGGWHHRTGQPHGTIHGELRRTCGGPPTAQATAAQLQQRIDTIREWAARGRRLA
jgi:superfamily II DNA or RNA helicase